jgi:hypothetical protein
MNRRNFISRIGLGIGAGPMLLLPRKALAARGPFTTSDYFQLGLNAIGSRINGAAGVAVAGWVYRTGTAAQEYILAEVTSATSSTAVLLGFAAGKITAAGRSQVGDSFNSVNGATTVPLSTWVHVVGVVNFSANTLSVYLNGILDATGAATFGSTTFINSASSTQQSCIGIFPDLTRPVLGKCAEVAIWNVVISNRQIMELASARSPLGLGTRPVIYFPLVNNQFSDPISGINAAQAGTVPQSDHPRIYQ